MVNGLSGERMLIGLAVGIAVLIFLVLKTKIQAFLALIISTVVVGVIGGMPLTNITIEVDGVEKTFGIVNSITSGFGGTLGSIGIIIGFGVMMGQIFEVTGAAKRMAHTFLKLFGKKREEEALALTGFLVSIPTFCDSGFVVLAPIAKAISKATKKSVIGLGTALAAGLVITHSLVPPTPGPLGVCGIFGVDVGKFILLTLVLALPMAIACIAYSRLFLSKKYYRIPNDEGEIVEMPYQEPNYEAAFAMDMTGVPGALESFMPLIIPIILILINTVATAMGKTEGFMNILVFLGQPIVAVGLGLIVAILTLGRSLDRHEALAEMEKGMASAGIIMLVTGGGGALGQIIKDSGLGTFMAEGLAKTAIPIIILPLLIATAMRFIQGSGTVAMTT
ncbi:GntP family permease, partial [Dorea longicatena]|uniref:GntP family permease n=1 Tax=Dorea longicatena TaxID=88431 RepID=UPI0032BFBD14